MAPFRCFAFDFWSTPKNPMMCHITEQSSTSSMYTVTERDYAAFSKKASEWQILKMTLWQIQTKAVNSELDPEAQAGQDNLVERLSFIFVFE